MNSKLGAEACYCFAERSFAVVGVVVAAGADVAADGVDVADAVVVAAAGFD